MKNSKYKTYDSKLFFCIHSSARPASGFRHIFWYLYGMSDNKIVIFSLRNTEYQRLYLNLTRNSFRPPGTNSFMRTKTYPQIGYIKI